jgi:hypothetical protein
MVIPKGKSVNAPVLRLAVAVLVAAAACSPSDDGNGGSGRDTTISTAALQPAMAAITGESILQHTNRLASDGFEGRAPGTAGEDSTVAYLTEQFKAIGLAPGNPDGTYIQPVSLIGYTSRPELTITTGSRRLAAECHRRSRGQLRPRVRRLRRRRARVRLG